MITTIHMMVYETCSRKFTKLLRTLGLGDVVISKNGVYPVQLPPKVQLSEDIKVKDGINHNLKKYLSRVTFHIENSCDYTCRHCSNAYRQFISCTKNIESTIDNLQMTDLLEELRGTSLYSINLVGGDVFRNGDFVDIVKAIRIEHKHSTINIYTDNQNIRKSISAIDKISQYKPTFRILVGEDYDSVLLKRNIGHLASVGINYEIQFIVMSVAGMKRAKNEIVDKKYSYYRTTPYCEHNNLSFIRKYLFTKSKDVLESYHDCDMINANQEINRYYFGHVHIIKDKFYSRIGDTQIGTMSMGGLADAIKKELLRRNSNWMNTRKKVEPCASCVYRYLCSPICDYNAYLKRNDMCTDR